MRFHTTALEPEHETSAMTGGSRISWSVSTFVCGFILLTSATSASGKCGAQLSGTSGHFTSPNFPNKYRSHYTYQECGVRKRFVGCSRNFAVCNCNWTITTETYKTIKLSWSSLEIPLENNCCPSYFEVIDGNGPTDPWLGGWCDTTTVPDPVFSTGNALYINVSVSDSTPGVIFSASWTTECKATILTTPNGTVASPKFPDPITEDLECRWTISVKPGHVIDFVFEEFRVGATDLPCDAATGEVSLYDNDFPSLLLGRYCNRTVNPGTLTSSGRHLTVVFKTKNMDSQPQTGGGHYFRGRYTSRLSADPSEEQREKLLLYGNVQHDQKLGRNETRSDCLQVRKRGRQFARSPFITIGQKMLDGFRVHEDGKISVVPYRDDSAESYICVYCTDIDHSGHHAGVWYHKYEAGESGQQGQGDVILQDVTQEIRKYSRKSSFEAKTVLLATWSNVTHKGNRLYTGEATFQAAIATDYDTTFVLIYYEKNSMGWQPREGLPVNGIAFHDISFGLRPFGSSFKAKSFSYSEEMLNLDKLKGNTGRRGTWIFTLEDLSSEPEGKCTQWCRRNSNNRTKTDEGFKRLPKCPCSERLARASGQWIPMTKSGRPQTVKICYVLSRSESSRHLPYSELCCYDSRGSYLKNLPEAGTCLANNPVFSSMINDYVTMDLEGYKACCEESDSCKVYNDLRPVPECVIDLEHLAEWVGDPHVITFDEKGYTFNGLGEYTLVTLKTDKVNLTLQGRTDRAETENGTPTDATVFTALGAEENGVRIFVGLEMVNKSSLIVYANGTDYTRQFQNDKAFLIDTESFQLLRNNESLVFSFPSGCGATISVRLKSLALSVNVPLAFQNQMLGLMGNFNGVKDDDFTLPNGTVLPSDMSDRDIFKRFGEQWRIKEDESVMRYGLREGPSNYQHPDFVPIFLDEQPPEVLERAKAVCGESNLPCLYDFVATGNEDFALDTKQLKEEADLAYAMAKNTMPEVTVPAVLNVTSGQHVTFTLQGHDPDENDILSYHAEDDGNGQFLVNSQTGQVSFTADASYPFILRVFAQDTYVRSPSSVIPVVMCSGCNGHGDCDFSLPSSSHRGNYHFQYALCVCQAAWDGPDCEIDRDECAGDPCLPQQTCTDLTPDQQGDSRVGYDCGPCPEGFVQDPTSRKCIDVDECVRDKKCEHNCFNTKGSYICSCRSGYRLDIDGHKCWEIDECQEKLDKCQHICKNTEGSYSCLCHEGYTLDASGTTCTQDTNTTALCENVGCSQGCRLKRDPNTGSQVPECFCQHGYDLDPANLKTCVDHDECQDGVCPQKCYNYPGGFLCYCYHGYRLSEDKRTCTPCPKWRYGANCELTCTCNGRAVDCHPVSGCVCEVGWTGDQCQEDVDECDQVVSVCGPDQVCVNTRGSYTCNCRNGYTLNSTGSSCTDIDECADLSVLNTCSETEQCVNVPGGFYCQCRPGYRRQEGACKDIDECAGGNHGCEQECVNVPGTYNCGCFYGYRLNLDRTTCSLVSDVCAEEEGLQCAHGCTLSDEDDRAICFCRTGYQLGTDSQSCVDINECTAGTASCSHTCTNREGGFSCTCPPGMKLDNDRKTCLRCPAGTFGTNCIGICACGIGSERCDAVSGCVCLTGWQGESCEDDVNECGTERVQQECREKNAECVNYPGGYRCQCHPGYKEDRDGICQDVDECLSTSCDQLCENTHGSFRCLCNTGFTLNSTTGFCQDVDECKLSVTNACSQRCVNTPGSYYCACERSGFTLGADLASCVATTQCTRADCPTTNGGCSQEKCFCNSGYTLTDSNTCEMEDVDWCAFAGCDHNCEESSDGKSFICSCRTGFLLQNDGTSCLQCPFGRHGVGCTQACTCEIQNTVSCDPVNGACVCKAGWKGETCSDDIDECMVSSEVSCPNNSRCVNTAGSYVCECDTGRYKDQFGVCIQCPSGRYGQGCTKNCACQLHNTVSCDPVNGACTCKAGWEGVTCSDRADVTRELKRVRVIFTLEGIDVPAEVLSDPSLPAYAQWSNAVKSAIESKLRLTVTGFFMVEIISLRRGSLMAETDIAMDVAGHPEVTQQLASTLVTLADDSLVVQGQEGKLHVTLNGQAVTSSWTTCDAYESIQQCSSDETCQVIDSLPQCSRRPSVDAETSEDNTVAIAVGVTIAVLVIIAVAAVAVWYFVFRKRAKFSTGSAAIVDVPVEVQPGPVLETTFSTDEKADSEPPELEPEKPTKRKSAEDTQGLISKD